MSITLVAFSSNACFAHCDSTNVHSIIKEVQTQNLHISEKLGKLSSKTICKFFKQDQSFNSINPKVLESLIVLIHQLTVILVLRKGL